MEKLIVKFVCLDGDYCLTIDNNVYSIETNIVGFDNKNGVIENHDEFVSKIKGLNINNWINENESQNINIEDAVKWSIQIDDYIVNGCEGLWPYNYDSLINILISLDQNISMFKANIGN